MYQVHMALAVRFTDKIRGHQCPVDLKNVKLSDKLVPETERAWSSGPLSGQYIGPIYIGIWAVKYSTRIDHSPLCFRRPLTNLRPWHQLVSSWADAWWFSDRLTVATRQSVESRNFPSLENIATKKLLIFVPFTPRSVIHACGTGGSQFLIISCLISCVY